MRPTSAGCRAVFLAGLVLAACNEGEKQVAGPPDVPSPPDVRLATEVTGRIAFVSNRDGTAQIYVMNADGSGVTQLTSDTAPSGKPTWSPDGSEIAFERGGGIYVMQADGSGVTKVIAPGYQPAWSPNGASIAFANNQIWVINTDGSGLTRLSDEADGRPAWSPDGSKIAFERSLDPEIWPTQVSVMNADGSAVHALSNPYAQGVQRPGLPRGPRLVAGRTDARLGYWWFRREKTLDGSDRRLGAPGTHGPAARVGCHMVSCESLVADSGLT